MVTQEKKGTPLLECTVAKYGCHKDYIEKNGLLIVDRNFNILKRFAGTSEALHSCAALDYLQDKTFTFYKGDCFTLFPQEDSPTALYVNPVLPYDQSRLIVDLQERNK